MLNKKKLRSRLKSKGARDVRIQRVAPRRYRMTFTTYSRAAEGIVGHALAIEGRTLRALAMRVGVA